MSESDREIERGIEHHRAGRLREAADLYQEVLRRDPQHAGALNLLGVAALQTGQVDQAIELLRRAAQASPNESSIHNNLGEAYRTAGRLEEALQAYNAALRLSGNDLAALSNLGVTLLDLRRIDEAIQVLRHAVSLRPAVKSHPQDATFAQVHSNLGAALMERDVGGAAMSYRRAIELNPQGAEAYTNLGELFRREGDVSAAIEFHRKAVAISPGLAPAYLSLGLAYQTAGDAAQAIAAYRQAIAINPRYRDAHENLLLALNYQPDVPTQEIFEEHVRWAQLHAPPMHANDRNPDRRLRIGYLSGDFREHAVARFIEGILERHDREQVEVHCYSNVSNPDAFTQRLQRLVPHWRDILVLDDDRAAALVREDQIDVLVDLSGHTAHNRLGILSRRPAPVQATYLGYPNTTGMTMIDWKITDAVADPPGEADGLYVERLMRLGRCAWCYGPPDDAPDVVPPPDGTIVFGSFNAAIKISDLTLRMWAAALRAVPESRLIVKCSQVKDQALRRRFDEAFGQRDVDPTRAELIPTTPSHREHMAVYGKIHIALDTFPYQGTTTTCEALWMGVPVVTLAGQTHASRVSVSLLQAAGFGEWVAQDEEQYVAVAARLAADRAGLSEIRSSLRDRLRGSSLLDAGSMARAIEDAYRQMWREWCASRPH